jgi:hypothetical protein
MHTKGKNMRAIASFWKFDFYSPGTDRGSENAAELSKIVRVLTILRLGVVIAAQRARHRAMRRLL